MTRQEILDILKKFCSQNDVLEEKQKKLNNKAFADGDSVQISLVGAQIMFVLEEELQNTDLEVEMHQIKSNYDYDKVSKKLKEIFPDQPFYLASNPVNKIDGYNNFCIYGKNNKISTNINLVGGVDLYIELLNQ